MFRVWFVLLVVAFVCVDCSPRSPSCNAGEVQACTCPSGAGERSCSSASTFGECLCGDAGTGGQGGGDFQGYAGGDQCAGSGCGDCTPISFDHACMRSENPGDPLGIDVFANVSGAAVVSRGGADGGCMGRYFDAHGGRAEYAAGVVSMRVRGEDAGEWEFEWAGHPADAGLAIATGDVVSVGFLSGFGPGPGHPNAADPAVIGAVSMSLVVRRSGSLMVLRGSLGNTPAPLPVMSGPRVCHQSHFCGILVDHDLLVAGDAGTIVVHKGDHAEVDDWLVSYGGGPTLLRRTCADFSGPRTSYGYTRLR